ncbi:Mitochondrial import receptor subunit TOM5 [Galemys pyrenaicus]|uniref:Mitochondrial import receptor subunit TOM5 n=1 Tax=Galemys pyrenaicus TaxID=202257 RepID=A0A8J6AB04_GALPY|nr:Mitochondrial import receptor subunit TOM5 [Galemys pyrenaicus]
MFRIEGLAPKLGPEEMKQKMREDVISSIRNFLICAALLRVRFPGFTTQSYFTDARSWSQTPAPELRELGFPGIQRACYQGLNYFPVHCDSFPPGPTPDAKGLREALNLVFNCCMFSWGFSPASDPTTTLGDSVIIWVYLLIQVQWGSNGSRAKGSFVWTWSTGTSKPVLCLAHRAARDSYT